MQMIYVLFYSNIRTTNLNTLQNKTMKYKFLEYLVSWCDTFKKNKLTSDLCETKLHDLNTWIQKQVHSNPKSR